MNQLGFSYDLADEGEASRRFWMDEASLSRTFSKAIPARAADLLDVVGAIYAADRQSKRCFQGDCHGTAQDQYPFGSKGAGTLVFAGVDIQTAGTVVVDQRGRLDH